MTRFPYWLAVTLLFASCPFQLAVAQSVGKEAAGAPQQGQANAPAIPDAYKLNMMIRSAVIALNQANKTGNYTVLQDLGAPAFRAANESVRLAQIFASLRQRNLDLSPILFFTPKLIGQPQLLENGILRLTGFFPTSPERVDFDLYFQLVENDWRIFGIGVTTSPADVTAAIAVNPQESTAPQAERQSADSQQDRPKVTPAAAPSAVTAPPPVKKPNASRQSAAERPAVAAAVENRTTDNATRIDLAKPQAVTQPWISSEEEPSTAPGNDASEPGFWGGFNPFSR